MAENRHTPAPNLEPLPDPPPTTSDLDLLDPDPPLVDDPGWLDLGSGNRWRRRLPGADSQA